MPRPTISLCMIVRDEEENLPECLESVKDFADEIIVVDTGSKDKTMEIARSFGAKLYEHPWPNSFSAARNISLSYATSDWILILDADEWLDRKYIPKINKILTSNKEYIGISFAIYSETATGMSKAYSVRLFKNKQGFHYEGIVHNQLKIHGRILTTECRVYHSGYNLPPAQTKKKFERSAKLLKDGIEKNPNNLYYRFQLGRLYRTQRMYQECIKETLTILDLSKSVELSEENILMVMCDLAYSYYKLEDYKQAEKVCLDTMSMRSDFPDIIIILGYVYFKTGRTREAIETFQKFIEAVKQREENPQYDTLMVDSIGLVDRAYHYIGEAYLELSCLDQAITNLKLALEYNPQNTRAYEGLICCYQKTRDGDRMKETCLEAVANKAASGIIKYQLGRIYKKEKKNPEAKKFIALALEIRSDFVPAYLDLVDIYFEEQNFQAVFSLLEKLRELEPVRVYRLYQALGDKEAAIGDYEGAIRAYNIILSHNPGDESARANLARCRIKLKQYEEAKRNYQTLLSVNPHHPEALRFVKLLEGMREKE